MPEYLSPGVYVEEVSRGPKPIEGVSTSTAGFLGETERGPTTPERVTSFAEFTRTYGATNVGDTRYLLPAIEGFFRNGGQRCYIGRISASTVTASATPGDDARPQPGILRADTTEFGFAGVVAGHEATAVATLTNLGNPDDGDPAVTVDPADFSPTGAGAGAFSAELLDASGDPSANPQDVDPGESVPLRVRFGPDAAGESEATLAVDYSSTEPALEFELVGLAVAPTPGQLGIAPGTVSFDTVPTGHSTTETVTVTNLGNPDDGDDDLTVNEDDVALVDENGAALPPGAAFTATYQDTDGTDVADGADVVIAPGDAVTVELTFAPTNIGRQEATLTVTDDADATTVSATLVGVGSEAGDGELTANVDGVDFGTVTVGHTAQRDVVVTNQGDPNAGHATISINAASITLTDAEGQPAGSDVSVTLLDQNGQVVAAGDPAVAVAPAESVTVRITYEAADVHARTLTLFVTDVGGNTDLSRSVTVSGVVMGVEAVGPGRWGRRVALVFEDGSLYKPGSNQLFKLTVWYWSDEAVAETVRSRGRFDTETAPEPSAQEVYDNLSPDASSSDYYRDRINDASTLIEVDPEGVGRPPTTGEPVWLDGAFPPADPQPGLLDFRGDAGNPPGERTGLAGFADVDNISIVCIPDEHTYGDYLLTQDLVDHCQTEARDRIAILQSPRGPIDEANAPPVDSSYAAFYYPWIHVRDPETSAKKLVPPGGHVAGIYARSDTERGVHKAPANEVVNGALKLEFDITKGDQAALNPKGVNCLRSFRGRGLRVWGARTTTSDPEWKYVNVRRLFLYIEESIDEGTQWVVFEPNNELLWARVRQTVANFLTTVWRDGALMGTSPDEAYYVKCDRTTMTQSDIDNGRLIVEVGVAPTKPAEFVIFRISQWTAGAGGA